MYSYVLVFSVVQRALTDRTRHHGKYSPRHASALLCPVFQDVINEAVGKASQEDEETLGATKDDEEDGASDASSVLGLDGVASPAPPKRRQSGKGPGSPARPSFGKAKPSKKGGNPPSSPAKVPLDQAQKALDLLKAVDAEDEEFTDQMTDVISGPSMDPETFQSVMTTVASKAAAEAFEFPLQFLCVIGEDMGRGHWIDDCESVIISVVWQ